MMINNPPEIALILMDEMPYFVPDVLDEAPRTIEQPLFAFALRLGSGHEEGTSVSRSEIARLDSDPDFNPSSRVWMALDDQRHFSDDPVGYIERRAERISNDVRANEKRTVEAIKEIVQSPPIPGVAVMHLFAHPRHFLLARLLDLEGVRVTTRYKNLPSPLFEQNIAARLRNGSEPSDQELALAGLADVLYLNGFLSPLLPSNIHDLLARAPYNKKHITELFYGAVTGEWNGNSLAS